MSDDGGICWFETVAEEQEYLEWLDKIESDKYDKVIPEAITHRQVMNEACIDEDLH